MQALSKRVNLLGAGAASNIRTTAVLGNTPKLCTTHPHSSAILSQYKRAQLHSQLPPVVPQASSLVQAALQSAPSLPHAKIFSAITGMMVPIYGMMIFAPRSKLTKAVVSSPVITTGLSILYVFLLTQALSAGLLETIGSIFASLKAPMYVPSSDALASLFCNPLITNLCWIHLLLLDFYQARLVMIDGIQWSVATGHSIALCFICGPVGLLSHFITRKFKTMLSGERIIASVLKTTFTEQIESDFQAG